MSNSNEELLRRFRLCTFTPITDDVAYSSPIRIEEDDDKDPRFSTISYYMDSSGRSRCLVPLQLSCRTKEDVEFIQKSGCLPILKSDSVNKNDSSTSAPFSGDKAKLRFEIISHLPTGSKNMVTVEEINAISCTVEGNSILIEIELLVRASKVVELCNPLSREAFQQSIISECEIPGTYVNRGEIPSNEASISSSYQLEVTAVLIAKKKINLGSKGIPGLVAMELVGGVIPFAEQSPMLQSRLPPVFLNLRITQALSISVRAVQGSTSGSTLVSLTMAHSNTHGEAVTITNIALHPGHSRSEEDMDKVIQTDQSMPGGQNLVTDMSKYVKWGFAPRTDLKLPLVMNPNESFSTILTIDAGKDLTSCSFFSPISITAVVGDTWTVVESMDVCWRTGRIAVEHANAFRVDLSLAQSSCYVGAPLVVTLRVLNLSTDTRDLMLLMAKDEEKNSSSAAYSSKIESVNTAVVSEVNGYTFGVWGLSGDDDGTARHSRDHELLAVDAALVLGEVKGQHSVDAELRFVPLREGTLDVPNLKLYDKIERKWYNCVHSLKLVAAGKKE